MRNLICFTLSLLFIIPSFASSNAELLAETTEVEVEANERISIKEIRYFIKDADPQTSCMDEYFKRRKQLILKLTLSPITIAAGIAASFFAGGASGAGVAYVTGTNNEWAGLGYVIGGALVGGVVGGVATVADTTIGVTHLLENNLILKALAEHHLDRPGEKMGQLYQMVMKKTDSTLSEEEFTEWLVDQDAEGKLCDGSMVKKPRIRLGSKLKYKVAKVKDLRKHLPR